MGMIYERHVVEMTFLAADLAGLEVEYGRALDFRLNELTQRPDATFTSIVQRAHGAPPDRVAQRLEVLFPSSHILSEMRTQPVPLPDASDPELHALNFEWYFTDNTVAALAAHLGDSPEPVLCLGAPTIAYHLATSGRPACLVDSNELIGARFDIKDAPQVWIADLAAPITFGRNFSRVFFDAPWYPEQTAYWLWQASRAVTTNGLVAFSLFPRLLRPTAARDRHTILAMAESLGSVEILTGALEYTTPRFAAETLSHDGLRLGGNWRRGDLVLVNVSRPGYLQAPAPPAVNGDWATFVLGKQVIKLRRGITRTLASPIAPLAACPHFTLSDTVRLRTIIDDIDVWTSRNRVAQISDAGNFAHVLNFLGSRETRGAADRLEPGCGIFAGDHAINRDIATLLDLMSV